MDLQFMEKIHPKLTTHLKTFDPFILDYVVDQKEGDCLLSGFRRRDNNRWVVYFRKVNTKNGGIYEHMQGSDGRDNGMRRGFEGGYGQELLKERKEGADERYW